jgi:hypothetical protein
MGLTKVNNREIVAPADQMRVADLKELANIPAHEKLYDIRDGHVFEDNDLISTSHRDYGATEDWERG